MSDRIWLSSPHMGGSEIEYVNRAFEANWIAPLGPNVNMFENKLKSYLDEDRHVAALSSGTAALHLALILAGVKKDDEVICQSLTFSASANPIKYQGAIPIFIDSESLTWNLDPNIVEEAIQHRIKKGKKPKAIIAVHLYGMPYQHDELKELSLKYEIPIIEDSAEALGSTYKGKKCGTLGDLAILSFNGNKIITTSGGGALVTTSKKVKDKAVFYATQSRDDAPHYQHSHIGYNYRLSNICASIGCGQMEVLENRVEERRAVHDFYANIFSTCEDVSLMMEPDENYFSNFWLSTIVLENDGYTRREKLRTDLLEKYNIESRSLWKPMHLQPYFSDAPYYGGNIAENLFRNGLCLPSGSNMSATDLERIAFALQEELKC